MPSSRQKLLPCCTTDHKQAGGDDIVLLRMFPLAAFQPLVFIEQIMKAADYLKQLQMLKYILA